MNTMKKILLVVLALGSLCFQGLAKDNVSTEKRGVQAFDKIAADGVFNLYLTQGSEDAVSVEVAADLQPEVSAEVKDGTLRLTTSKKLSKSKESEKCKVYVTFKNLKALNFDGVGSIKTNAPIKGEAIALSIDGVGNVELKLEVKQVKLDVDGVGSVVMEGKAESLQVKKDGVGKLDAGKLMAEVVSIRNSGVGNARVYASRELSMVNSGVGNLSYSGDAVIKSVENDGVGKIKKEK